MHLLAFLLQEQQPNPEQAMKIAMAIVPFIGLMMLIALVIVIVPSWFICKKAGFSPWLALINLIPLGNLVLLYVLAFAEWKVVPSPQAGLYPPPYPPPPPPPYPPQA
jgi:ABC-type transport system involved in cytochrome c biogenesis permease subunit